MTLVLISLVWLLAGYAAFALGAYRGFTTGHAMGHERGYRTAREHMHTRQAAGLTP